MMSFLRGRWVLPAVALFAVGALAAMFFFVLSVGLYARHWDGPLVRRMADILPIPAAKLGSERVYYREYLKDADSLRTFLASEEAVALQANRDVTAEDLQQVVERRLRELAVFEAAGFRGIQLSQAEIDAAVRMFIPADKTESDLDAFLATNYNWTREDFLTHMVRPALLTQKLAVSFAADHGGDPNAFETYLNERLQRPDVVRYMRW